MSQFSNRFREIPKYLQRVTSEQAEQARNTNLVEFLSGREELVKMDNHGRYRHKYHDSLIFRGAFYWWNSRGEKGNALDFMKSFYGIDFKTAVAELTGRDLSTKKEFAPVPQPKQIPVSESFILPALNKDMRRTFAYLIKTRCIDASIIQFLAKEKLLLQDQRGNAVFPWISEKGEIVGAELNGTLTDKRFKGIVANSSYGYGYNVRIGSPTALYAFESAIDLLSFWSLNKGLKDVLLVSMGGLKEEVLEGFLKRHTGPLETFLGVDNDEAGKTFIKAVQAKINAKTALPPKGKDWNEYLKANHMS